MYPNFPDTMKRPACNTLTADKRVTVLAAVLLGKLLKYGLTAWLSLHFPGTLRRWINRASRSRPDSLHR